MVGAPMAEATALNAAVCRARAAKEGWAAIRRVAASAQGVSADGVPVRDEPGPSRVEAAAQECRPRAARALPTDIGTPSPAPALAARPDRQRHRALDRQRVRWLGVTNWLPPTLLGAEHFTAAAAVSTVDAVSTAVGVGDAGGAVGDLDSDTPSGTGHPIGIARGGTMAMRPTTFPRIPIREALTY